MDKSQKLCCFCLSVLKAPFTDIFKQSRDGLTYFGIVTSSFTLLANILNENSECDYLLCGKCCGTIETMYQFHQACLSNIGIYLAKGRNVPKTNECTVYSEYDNYIKTEINIKNEFDECETEDAIASPMSCSESLHNELIEPEIETAPPDLQNEILHDPLEVENELIEKDLQDSKKKLHENQNYRKSNRQKPVKKELIYVNNNKFICGQCGKMFNHRHHLSEHLHIHSGVKPFKCETCGKAFCRKSDLNRHIATYKTNEKKHLHLSVRPFKCDVCGKGFQQKTSLARHRPAHTGEKFTCDICNKSFTQKYNLKKHKKKLKHY